MHEFHQLIRGLAHRLAPCPTLSTAVVDDADAVRLFVEVAHGGLCPGCHHDQWTPLSTHKLECLRCGSVSMFKGTEFHRRRLRAKHLLAAIFAIFVDTSATSSRAFSRRNGLRLATSWQLLHDVRDALPRVTPTEPGLVAPVLGGVSEANVAHALLATDDDDRLVALDCPAGAPPGRIRRELPLWLGRLRGWLTEVFRGVSAKHLWRYLAEFAARHGRVARKGASHV
jgi:hypothetical protein